MKISTLRALFHTELSLLYEEREIDAMFFIYIEDKFGIKKHHYFLSPDHEVVFKYVDIEALSKGMPIQYVTGITTFYNLQFEINSSALIPRPETEELITMILKKKGKIEIGEGRIFPLNFEEMSEERDNLYENQKILDIGTGSGAIAIALAKNIKNANVWATDISERALEIAKKNAAHCDVKITFLHHDILKSDTVLLPDNLDVIVSNPPYIPQKERNNLHTNIIDYEPNIALFVPDENPLIFYNTIAQIAKKNLRKGGLLYFETHEKFHFELSTMLAEIGFKEIELWNDINNKPRFVSCKKL